MVGVPVWNYGVAIRRQTVPTFPSLLCWRVVFQWHCSELATRYWEGERFEISYLMIAKVKKKYNYTYLCCLALSYQFAQHCAEKITQIHYRPLNVST